MPSSYPAFFEKYESVKMMYSDNKNRTDEICREIENSLDEQKKNVKIEGSMNECFADHLIFNYAITLCKDAAKDEYLKNYLRAGEKYKEGVLLLDYLANNKEENNPDWQVFEGYVNDTHRRYETVNVKLTTA